MGGLFAGLLLRQSGWDVSVFERSQGELASRGAGIGISQELIDLLERVEAPLDTNSGIVQHSSLWLGQDGELKYELAGGTSGSSWARVYSTLRAGFPDKDYNPGRELVDIEQDEHSVTAIFADDSRETGDLLVASDGNTSTIRQKFQPNVEPQFPGYVAWRGIVDGSLVKGDAQKIVHDHIIFSFVDSGFMLTMEVPGAADATGDDAQRFYFIWYRPTASDDVLRDMFTDASGKYHGVAIPPPLIRPVFIEQMKADAAAEFWATVAEPVIRAPQPLLQAISDMESDRLVFGRVAIMGDAAFIARPHVASGITKAALDAESLADSLSAHGDLETGLSAFETARLSFGREIVAHSRRLGYYIEHERIKDADAALKKFRDPIHVMDHYGAPHLLRAPDMQKSSR